MEPGSGTGSAAVEGWKRKVGRMKQKLKTEELMESGGWNGGAVEPGSGTGSAAVEAEGRKDKKKTETEELKMKKNSALLLKQNNSAFHLS